MKKFTLILVLTPMFFFCQPGVNSSTEIVDVTNPITGDTWMDRNLGASRAATSSTDAASYGDLYQWGREADGHQLRNSGTTTTLSSTDQPAHNNFILAPDSPYDWRSPQNNNLWQGVNGVNNPCPTGYRLPTEAEWQVERQSWSTNNAAGAFASPLKLPKAGWRLNSSGLLSNTGIMGGYWSSTVSSSHPHYMHLLDFSDDHTDVGIWRRANGISVRCLKDKILNVNDNPLQSTMVYPNPVTDVLNLNALNPIQKVEVFDIQGRLIMEKTLNSLNAEIAIDHLKTGSYFISVFVNNSWETYQFLKK